MFPWCYAFVPMEVRFEHVPLLPLTAFFEVVGTAYTAVFLTILVHEGGHWFFGRLVGIRLSEFAVGTGSERLEFAWRGVRFAFGPWLRWGYVREIPARENMRFGKQFVFLAGGVVAEIIFLGALYYFPASAWGPGPLEEVFDRLCRFAWVSGGFGICASLWPRLVAIEGRETPNDALLIQRAWANRGKEEQTWQTIRWGDEVNALAASGRYAEAASVLERMLAADPGNTEWRTILASLHAGAQEWDRAMLAHHEAIQRSAPGSRQRVQAVDAAATLALHRGRREDLARLRPLVEEALRTDAQPTLAGTLGSLLIELDETVAGVKLLNQCLAGTDAAHDRAIANAYLAKAALRMGRRQRAEELLGFARGAGSDHPLARRVVEEIEPALRAAEGGGASTPAAS